MKLFFKILMAPFMLLIMAAQAVCSFIAGIASGVLGIISLAVLAVSVFWFVTEGFRAGMTALVFAVIISPVGLPMFAQFLIEITKSLRKRVWDMCA